MRGAGMTHRFLIFGHLYGVSIRRDPMLKFAHAMRYPVAIV